MLRPGQLPHRGCRPPPARGGPAWLPREGRRAPVRRKAAAAHGDHAASCRTSWHAGAALEPGRRSPMGVSAAAGGLKQRLAIKYNASSMLPFWVQPAPPKPLRRGCEAKRRSTGAAAGASFSREAIMASSSARLLAAASCKQCFDCRGRGGHPSAASSGARLPSEVSSRQVSGLHGVETRMEPSKKSEGVVQITIGSRGGFVAEAGLLA